MLKSSHSSIRMLAGLLCFWPSLYPSRMRETFLSITDRLILPRTSARWRSSPASNSQRIFSFIAVGLLQYGPDGS
jgi:hypothetical protein